MFSVLISLGSEHHLVHSIGDSENTLVLRLPDGHWHEVFPSLNVDQNSNADAVSGLELHTAVIK